jgi:hypothetical protein
MKLDELRIEVLPPAKGRKGKEEKSLMKKEAK